MLDGSAEMETRIMAASKPNNLNQDDGAIQVYAIGGGGFTHLDTALNSDGMLENYLLTLVPGLTELPKIGYVGHANGDNPKRISAFYARFLDCAKASHLPLSADASAARDFANDLDIIYVSGGSTKQMLQRWRNTGLDDVFCDAGRRGVILAGVSAGAICWFSELLLGSAEDGFVQMPGLGLIAGSACPHYDSEPERRDAFDKAIVAGSLKPGIAIDDGVAVHIVAGQIHRIIRARHGHAVFVKAGRNENSVRLTLSPGFDLAGGTAKRMVSGQPNQANRPNKLTGWQDDR